MGEEDREACARMVLGALDDMAERFGLNLKGKKVALVGRDSDKANAMGLCCPSRLALSFSRRLILAESYPAWAKKAESEPAGNPGEGFCRLVACQSLLEGSRVSKRKARAYQQAVVRHELGHLLSKPKHVKALGPYLANKECKRLFAAVVSRYGATSRDEALAEVFALVTSPGYRAGTLCAGLERLALSIIEEWNAGS